MDAIGARDADAVARACSTHVEQAGLAGLDALKSDPPG
jgi:DNA-binding GntR family transcriptional regulator